MNIAPNRSSSPSRMPPPSASARSLPPPARTLVRIGVKKGGCAGMEYTMSYADDEGAA